MDKLDMLLVFILIGIVTGLTIFLMFIWEEQEKNNQNIESLLELSKRLKMYDGEALNQTLMNGYYSSVGYYCVWTENRTYDEINETDYHENAHSYIAKDYEHFCGK